MVGASAKWSAPGRHGTLWPGRVRSLALARYHFRERKTPRRTRRTWRAAPSIGKACGMVSVLIADDSQTVRMLLRDWLTQAGYTVDEAADGQQALAKLQASAGRSDERVVVLLDYQMPVMDGYEMLQRAAAAGMLPPRYSYVMISAAVDTFPPEFSTLLRQLGIQILHKPAERETVLGVTRFLIARMEQAASGGATPPDKASGVA
jgi:CheY-like chemotaxis protein